jgi:outer membrane protein OmpA-like peptidoglycan-associated protein
MVSAAMPRYENYRAYAAELPSMRRWVFRAFVVSLLIHGGLFVFFQFKQIDAFAPPPPPPEEPIRFVVNKVTIDPSLLQPPPKEIPKVTPKPQEAPIVIPQEKPQPREIELKPQTAELASPILGEKPKAAPVNLEALMKKEAIGSGDRDLGTIASALLSSSVKSPNQPVLQMPPVNKENVEGGSGIPGRQSLDEALASAGKPTGHQQPVAMPGGALFEHGKAELRPEALQALEKVGQLFLLYPDAIFLISGHTDWTGTAEFNQLLSEERADAVKQWLVTTMKIAPERIQTVGRGSAEAIVPADRSVDEQQPNRRVEILIRPRQK